jgi:transcriptional antiterminator
MKLYSQLALLKQIHFLIEHKSTGNPKDFANRLRISERTLYRILAELKDQEVSIVYNASRGAYVYKKENTILKLLKKMGGVK